MKIQMNTTLKNLLISTLALMYFASGGSPPVPTHPAGSAQEIKPLEIGDNVPQISILSAEGDSVLLHEAYRNKPLILIFYRGGWCPYCNTQLSSLAKIQDTLLEMGFEVFGISPDKPEFLKESKSKHDLKINFLSDSQAKLALAFGIAFKVDDGTVKKYKKWNMDLEKNSGQAHHILPVPSVFMVDKQGKIRFAYSNPDYKVRLEPDSLLATAKKFSPH